MKAILFDLDDTLTVDEQAAVEAHEACMVGDSLHRDIAGARALGIRAIWLNRDNKPLADDITPGRGHHEPRSVAVNPLSFCKRKP